MSDLTGMDRIYAPMIGLTACAAAAALFLSVMFSFQGVQNPRPRAASSTFLDEAFADAAAPQTIRAVRIIVESPFDR